MAAETGPTTTRSAEAEKFWNETGVDPVVVHLGKDTGFTLRAYRMSDTLPQFEQAADVDDVEAEDDERPDIADNPEDTAANDEPGEEDFLDEDVLDSEPEEVPVFLSRKGKVLLFKSKEALVDYVKASDDNDLAVIDEYADLQERIDADYIACDEADNYELDLVTTNLRGGHDSWEPELLVKAAEAGRDLGYALRLQSVVDALAPGSPLDDVDEALRVIVDGGIRASFAKRRLRKMGTEQAAIAWRGVIGKISDASDWRNGTD